MFPITSNFLFLFQIFSIWRVLIIVIQWRSKILFQLKGAVNVIKDMNYVSTKSSVTTVFVIINIQKALQFTDILQQKSFQPAAILERHMKLKATESTLHIKKFKIKKIYINNCNSA